jgi:hypothetical protein
MFCEVFKTFADIIFNSSEKFIGRLKVVHIHWKWEKKTIYEQGVYYGPTPLAATTQIQTMDVSEHACIWTQSNRYCSKNYKLN